MFDGVYTRWRINSDFSIERAGYGLTGTVYTSSTQRNQICISQGLSLQSMHLLAIILVHVSTIITLTQIALLSYVSQYLKKKHAVMI